jgi:hypothetical protein
MFSDVQASKLAMAALPCIDLDGQCLLLAFSPTERLTARLHAPRLDLWHRSFYSEALAVRNGPMQAQSRAATEPSRAPTGSPSTEDTP